jgi:hypothetical protein
VRAVPSGVSPPAGKGSSFVLWLMFPVRCKFRPRSAPAPQPNMKEQRRWLEIPERAPRLSESSGQWPVVSTGRASKGPGNENEVRGRDFCL